MAGMTSAIPLSNRRYTTRPATPSWSKLIAASPDRRQERRECRSTTRLPSDDIKLFFVSKIDLAWTVGPCAQKWNLYRETAARLVDGNGDRLADSYGQCFRPDLPMPQTIDQSDPPLHQTHYYLVTAENTFGEGGLGYNSELLERPNLSACP